MATNDVDKIFPFDKYFLQIDEDQPHEFSLIFIPEVMVNHFLLYLSNQLTNCCSIQVERIILSVGTNITPDETWQARGYFHGLRSHSMPPAMKSRRKSLRKRGRKKKTVSAIRSVSKLRKSRKAINTRRTWKKRKYAKRRKYRSRSR